MRASGSALPAARLVLVAVRRTAGFLREAVLLAAFVAALEMAGPYAPHDGADLVVLAGAVLTGMLLAAAGRAAWMPRTQRAVREIRRRAVRWGRSLSPRYAVAFRPTEGAEPLADNTLIAPLGVLALAGVALTLLGARTFEGLLFLKVSVSYTLYLAALALLWSILFLAVIGGCILVAHWLHAVTRGREGLRARVPLLAFGVACFLGFVVLTWLPGAAPLAALLLLGWGRSRAMAEMPAHSYLFCRRDAQGRPRAIAVHKYLWRVHAAIVLALAIVIVLGRAQRLWQAEGPIDPFAFTSWLGVLSSLCALLLMARVGVHLQRLMGGGGVPPEVPLTPTLWLRMPGRNRGPETSEAWSRFEPWGEVARENGWLVLSGTDEPETEYDLVMGAPSDARRFVPRPPTDDADARFQLERRFHVVMRRRFHRAFQSLYKKLKAQKPDVGSGFLFCPHVWLVPGVVRDSEPGARKRKRGSDGLVGPVFYGPPYAQAFPPRVRRYLGTVLRTLQVDIIYWEDSIHWPDLRRVLGVLFETYDQGRAPLLERHFVGVPRVRIVIQEEAAEPEPQGDALAGGPSEFGARSPGHARILIITRDRGGEAEELTPDPSGSWVRTPSLV